VNRLNGVVTQFLDYSRPLKPALAPTSVNEVLDRTFKLLGPQVPAGVELELQLAEWLPRVNADAEQLKQVFLNLALNAFQAMGPGGGRLAVSTRLARDELAFWREGPRRADVVEVRFRDSGPGIPEESHERVFVPFFTTKEKGTGLGLAICQRLVKAHQGSIQLRSQPGAGAEFLVSLPGMRDERPPETARAPVDADEKARVRERRRAGAEARLRRLRRRRQQA
jgi:signal transduction histidine kinase